jgi:hypothetical protein
MQISKVYLGSMCIVHTAQLYLLAEAPQPPPPPTPRIGLIYDALLDS